MSGSLESRRILEEFWTDSNHVYLNLSIIKVAISTRMLNDWVNVNRAETCETLSFFIALLSNASMRLDRYISWVIERHITRSLRTISTAIVWVG